METRIGLDWLSCTMLSDTSRFLPGEAERWKAITTLRGILDGVSRATEWRFRRGRYGYLDMLRDEVTGTELMFNGSGTGMGEHLILPGTALTAIRTDGIGEAQVVAMLGARDARPSRVDVALDIFDGTSILEYLADARDGLVNRGTNVTVRWFTGYRKEDGTTIYIGKPSSDRQVRVYDKAAQTGNMEREWIRIELVLRRKLAQVAWPLILKGNLSEIISDVFARWDFPSVLEYTTWQQRGFPSGHPIRKLRSQEQHRMTKGQWLENVIKAVALGIEEIGVDRFWSMAQNANPKLDNIEESGI